MTSLFRKADDLLRIHCIHYMRQDEGEELAAEEAWYAMPGPDDTPLLVHLPSFKDMLETDFLAIQLLGLARRQNRYLPDDAREFLEYYRTNPPNIDNPVFYLLMRAGLQKPYDRIENLFEKAAEKAAHDGAGFSEKNARWYMKFYEDNRGFSSMLYRIGDLGIRATLFTYAGMMGANGGYITDAQLRDMLLEIHGMSRDPVGGVKHMAGHAADDAMVALRQAWQHLEETASRWLK
ncbi:hypothetical protein GC177_06285 [bacterium]|nr:hypothetical protein [bacterium]